MGQWLDIDEAARAFVAHIKTRTTTFIAEGVEDRVGYPRALLQDARTLQEIGAEQQLVAAIDLCADHVTRRYMGGVRRELTLAEALAEYLTHYQDPVPMVDLLGRARAAVEHVLRLEERAEGIAGHDGARPGWGQERESLRAEAISALQKAIG